MDDLPRMGGSWASAFFLVGLLVPFRNLGLQRLRWFLVGALLLFIVVQAFGRTHVSSDLPQINTENLLVVLAPLVLMFGVALFLTLLEQLSLPVVEAYGVATTAFVVIISAPLIFILCAAIIGIHDPAPESPYSPLHIRQTAAWMDPSELMVSDIPGGVAWYGHHPCAWLPLDDENEFYRLRALKPIHGLFLTQATTDKPYLSGMKSDTNTWGHFVLECAEHGDVPTGFPMRKSPVGLLPAQLFLSDHSRWLETPRKSQSP